MKPYFLYSILATMVLMSSCRVYTQDIMLQVKDGNYAGLRQQMAEAERTYTIQPNDLLEIDIYTNKGERIIDPDFALARELGGGQQGVQRVRPQFLVQPNGELRLPMIGYINLSGKTLNQADSILAAAFSEFYKDPYVLTRYGNKRVIVLGTAGQVVPLTHQNMNLLEVLALTGGITGRGKAYNIRLIRGDLDNPQVQLINLSTIEGMRKASLQVQSGDIIYVEPIRRLLPETLRDIGPVVGLISNLIGLTLVIISLSNR